MTIHPLPKVCPLIPGILDTLMSAGAAIVTDARHKVVCDYGGKTVVVRMLDSNIELMAVVYLGLSKATITREQFEGADDPAAHMKALLDGLVGG